MEVVWHNSTNKEATTQINATSTNDYNIVANGSNIIVKAMLMAKR